MSKMSLSKTICADKRAYRKKVLDRICDKVNFAAKSSITGKAPYGYTQKLLKEIQEEESWLILNMVNYALKKFYIKNGVLGSNATCTGTKNTAQGRPKGSTNLQKHHLREVILATKNKIATIYLKEKEKTKKQGLKLANGWLNNQIVEISLKRGVPNDISISASTI